MRKEREKNVDNHIRRYYIDMRHRLADTVCILCGIDLLHEQERVHPSNG